MGGSLPPPQIIPPELREQGWAAPPPSRASAQGKISALPPAEQVDSQGRIYAKQYLHTTFFFDGAAHLLSFGASGPAIEQSEANKNFHFDPKMTDSQIAAAIKQSGAKYGPDDKTQFIKDLPLRRLEPFLGSLELISITFLPLSSDRAELPNWPDWTVRVRAKREDGTTANYKLRFDHVNGALTSLCTGFTCGPENVESESLHSHPTQPK